MKFAIFTHVLHYKEAHKYYAYAPYVTEMNIWEKYVDNLIIVAPLSKNTKTNIDSAYTHSNIKFLPIKQFHFLNLRSVLLALVIVPKIGWTIFKAMRDADHIHLRCPGNVGLLACFIQILFPKKIKTAKYAGNWDPNAKQPLSYKLQKWILSNTFLTKNMQVLVYGDWKNQTKNIKPFFTATYYDSEKEIPLKRNYSETLKFVFTGSLVEGKRPLLAIKTVEVLHKKGIKVVLDVYGDGILKDDLLKYIHQNNLQHVVYVHGNQDKHTIKEALKSAHFLLLLSKSEGWPKAIAEAMFFGVIPIATAVSCLPNMLDFGKRGILVEAELSKIVERIVSHLDDELLLNTMSEAAYKWSQKYTLDVFEKEIVKLITRK